MNTVHYYEVNQLWKKETVEALIHPFIPSKKIDLTEKGISNELIEKWTIQHLFVVAVNQCLMNTFLIVAENSKLEFISFECNAIAKIEKIGSRIVICEIELKPKLVLLINQREAKAIRVFDRSEKACAIANTINTKIKLEPIILFQ